MSFQDGKYPGQWLDRRRVLSCIPSSVRAIRSPSAWSQFELASLRYTVVAQDTLAASLSALLGHPSYGVRFEAAVALASLGSALPWCAAGLLQQVICEADKTDESNVFFSVKTEGRPDSSALSDVASGNQQTLQSTGWAILSGIPLQWPLFPTSLSAPFSFRKPLPRGRGDRRLGVDKTRGSFSARC